MAGLVGSVTSHIMDMGTGLVGNVPTFSTFILRRLLLSPVSTDSYVCGLPLSVSSIT